MYVVLYSPQFMFSRFHCFNGTRVATTDVGAPPKPSFYASKTDLPCQNSLARILPVNL